MTAEYAECMHSRGSSSSNVDVSIPSDETPRLGTRTFPLLHRRLHVLPYPAPKLTVDHCLTQLSFIKGVLTFVREVQQEQRYCLTGVRL